jgi:hypothetical protein
MGCGASLKPGEVLFGARGDRDGEDLRGVVAVEFAESFL